MSEGGRFKNNTLHTLTIRPSIRPGGGPRVRRRKSWVSVEQVSGRSNQRELLDIALEGTFQSASKLSININQEKLLSMEIIEHREKSHSSSKSHPCETQG